MTISSTNTSTQRINDDLILFKATWRTIRHLIRNDRRQKYDYEQFRKFSNKQFNQFNDRNTDRQNVKYTQHSRFSSKSNNAYQNNLNRIERSKMKITIKIENQKEINERNFDKAKQMNTDKKRRNDRLFRNDKLDKNEKKEISRRKAQIKSIRNWEWSRFRKRMLRLSSVRKIILLRFELRFRRIRWFRDYCFSKYYRFCLSSMYQNICV